MLCPFAFSFCIKQIGNLDPIPILDCFLDVRVDAGPLDQKSVVLLKNKTKQHWTEADVLPKSAAMNVLKKPLLL
ncbi:hypothetical protein IC575_005152 [Cucumis melo]